MLDPLGNELIVPVGSPTPTDRSMIGALVVIVVANLELDRLDVIALFPDVVDVGWLELLDVDVTDDELEAVEGSAAKDVVEVKRVSVVVVTTFVPEPDMMFVEELTCDTPPFDCETLVDVP